MDERNNKIIMYGSDEAATIKTGISGWVSRGGRFFGNDERAARFDGCTHVVCEDCGQPVEKSWTVCKSCRLIRDKKRYDEKLKEAWDEKGMVYSESADEYFSAWEEVEDYLEYEGGEIQDLRLVICEPNYLPILDSGDYGCDEMAEDGELPSQVIRAIEDFNNVIKEAGPVSWSPGKRAVLLPERYQNLNKKGES